MSEPGVRRGGYIKRRRGANRERGQSRCANTAKAKPTSREMGAVGFQERRGILLEPSRRFLGVVARAIANGVICALVSADLKVAGL